MTKLDYNLQKTLEWCAANDVVFKATNRDGLLAITAKCQNIFAEFVVDQPLDAARLGNAVWASLFSVKHGTEFHAKHGHFPPVGDPQPVEAAGGEAGSEGGGGDGGGGGSPTVLLPSHTVAPPNLRTGAVQ